jgi:hypothetical protein
MTDTARALPWLGRRLRCCPLLLLLLLLLLLALQRYRTRSHPAKSLSQHSSSSSTAAPAPARHSWRVLQLLQPEPGPLGSHCMALG